MSAQYDLPSPPTDPISAVEFSPHENSRLLVSSWDRNLYLYDVVENTTGALIHAYEHRAPILDCCWGPDSKTAFTVGLDCDVRRIDLDSGVQTILSTHRKAANKILYSAGNHMLVSASWDCTLHVHFVPSTPLDPDHPEGSPPIELISIPLPSKPFSIAATPTKLIVAMASRQYYIYNRASVSAAMAQLSQSPATEANLASSLPSIALPPWQSRESSLKFMTRAVAAMPTDDGYATSSIEGRVAVEWFDASAESQKRKYAFKCHRQTERAGAGPEDGDVDVVYPVNALAFHPIVQTTFASGGGDGVVALWDSLKKRRIRQYAKFSASVAALAWSADGSYLAVGVSPGFEDGVEEVEGDVKVVVRVLGEGEVKGKEKGVK